jgi:hypothetical protein
VRAEDDKVHTTDLPQEQQAFWSGCVKDLVQEAWEKDLVQKAFDLLEETINQLENVSHQRDRQEFQVGFPSHSCCNLNNFFPSVYLYEAIPTYCL